MGRPLVDRADRAELVSWSRAQGGEKYMSSTDMYRHLNLLENLVAGNVSLCLNGGLHPYLNAIIGQSGFPPQDRHDLFSGIGHAIRPQDGPQPW